MFTRTGLGLRLAPLPLTIDDGITGVAISGCRASIAAASLYVAVLASDGEPVYEGLAGLDVIQEVARGCRVSYICIILAV